MTKLLVYGYSAGVFSWRKIHLEALQELFAQVLEMALESTPTGGTGSLHTFKFPFDPIRAVERLASEEVIPTAHDAATGVVKATDFILKIWMPTLRSASAETEMARRPRTLVISTSS